MAQNKVVLTRCFVCKKEIPDNHPSLYFKDQGETICMGCEKAEIDVWRVSLPGSPGGYIDHDFQRVVESMDESESYIIRKERMKVGKYLVLPEFQGF